MKQKVATAPSRHQASTALIAACKEVAAGCTAAPLLVQLDHADDEESIRAALGAGVDGVMADGSGYPLEENMVWTARMAALAHASGATVEAELGRLAGEEDGLSIDEKDAKSMRSHRPVGCVKLSWTLLDCDGLWLIWFVLECRVPSSTYSSNSRWTP